MATADITAAQCLHSLLTGTHGREVPAVPGLTPRKARAVQFLNAMFQCTRLTGDDVRRGCRRRVGAARIEELLACPETRIALFHDGTYHRAEEPRSLDVHQVQRLRTLGWEAVRVDATLMADLSTMVEDIQDAVTRAVAAAPQPFTTRDMNAEVTDSPDP